MKRPLSILSCAAGPRSLLAVSLMTMLALLVACGGGGSSTEGSDGGSGSSSSGSGSGSDSGADASGSSSSSGDSASTGGSSSSSSTSSGGSELPVDLRILLTELDEEASDKRISALEEIMGKGEEAAPIVEQVRARTKDDDVDVRIMAAHALVKVEGDSSIPTLTTMLKDDDMTVRRETLNVLSSFPAGKVSGPISSAIDDDDAAVRAEAIQLIGSMGIEDGDTIAKLEGALEDLDGSVMRAAITALGDLISEDSAGKIARCVLDRDEGVRENACKVLAELGVATDETIPALIRGLDDDTLGVRDAAFSALMELTEADDTFGYSPVEVDEETRSAAVEKWTKFWESKSESNGG